MGKLGYIVQKNCPICGSPWKGGTAKPGDVLPYRRRIFYGCGCSISLQERLDMGALIILVKNCTSLIREERGFK
jgi:hypothetical protein